MSDYTGPVELSKGTIVGELWKVDKKIGQGGSAAVYKALNVESNKLAALKVESNFVQGGSMLKFEVDILTRMAGKRHVPQLFDSGKNSALHFMAMSLLGRSVNALLKKCDRSFSPSTQLRIALYALHGLKQIHDIGYVHRDVKTGNLALGRSPDTDNNMVYLLDFGMARRFVVKNDSDELIMRAPRARCPFRGTPKFTSIPSHERAEQGRCNDLWSWLYVVAEMREPLPWTGVIDESEILEQKRNTSDEQLLCKGDPQLVSIATHLRTLDYFSRPDYTLIYQALMDSMRDGGHRFSDKWDWEHEKDLESESPFCAEDFAADPLGVGAESSC